MTNCQFDAPHISPHFQQSSQGKIQKVTVTPSPTSKQSPSHLKLHTMREFQDISLSLNHGLSLTSFPCFFRFEEDSVGTTGVFLYLLILKTTGSVLKLSVSLNPWMQLFFKLDKPIESKFAAATNLPLGGGLYIRFILQCLTDAS